MENQPKSGMAMMMDDAPSRAESLANRLENANANLLAFVYRKGDGTFNDRLHDLIAEAALAFRSTEGYPGIAHDFETMRSALQELVDCRDMHDRVENRGNGISAEEARELNREYRRRRPRAWEAARAALKAAGGK